MALTLTLTLTLTLATAYLLHLVDDAVAVVVHGPLVVVLHNHLLG